MAWTFNPFTKKLDYYETGGGSGPVIPDTAPNFSSLPAASLHSGEIWWVLNSQGTAWLPGTLGGTYYPKGIYYSNGTTWDFVPTPYQATQTTVNAETVQDQFVSPFTLGGWFIQKLFSLTSKTTPVDADTITGTDSASSNSPVKFTWANIKATLWASPALTGTPTAPTAANGTNTTQIATTAFVNSAIINSVPNVDDTMAQIYANQNFI